jgi:hypothetical protein
MDHAAARPNSVAWVDKYHLLVFGTNVSSERTSATAGVALVDTRNWLARQLVSSAGGALAIGDGRIIVYGDGNGVRVLNVEGKELWDALPGTTVSQVEILRQSAYAFTASAVFVLDVASGRVAATLPPQPRLLAFVKPAQAD